MWWQDDELYQEWKAAAQKAQVEQLAGVQASAQQWGTSIGALTGAFGLIALARGVSAITSLRTPWDAVGTIMLLAALLSALAAIGVAALAAQGSSTNTAGDPLNYHDTTVAAARTAADRLRDSRLIALASLALVLATILLTWLGPQASTPQHFLVSSASAPVLCGTLSRSSAGAVTLIVPGRPAIALRGAYTFVPVSSCP